MALYPQSAKTYKSYGTANSGVVQTGESVILSLAVCNLSTVTRYLLLYDVVAFDPAANIREVIPVYANSGYTILDSAFFTLLGESYLAGICWGFSADPLSYQAAEVNKCLLKLRYL